MSDFQATIDALQGLNADMRHTIGGLAGVIARLEQARSHVAGLDDPHARNAETAINTALTQLHEATGGWFPDYQRRSNDLIHRIAQ